MPNFKVIAIDPGGTTGLTIARKKGSTIKCQCSQVKLTPREFLEFLMIHANSADHFIIEDFEFRKGARAGLDFTPAHLIGVAMAVVPPDKLRLQKASVGKSHFKNDQTIKVMKLWIPGKPHAMDSLRHFLQWYTFGPGYRYHDAQTTVQLDPLL